MCVGGGSTEGTIASSSKVPQGTVLCFYLSIHDVYACVRACVCVRVRACVCVCVCPARLMSRRRSVSLDVEISASGFTKDLERDAALLQPAGPGEEEEEEGDEEEAGEEGEDSVDLEEYRHAMLELEGLKVCDPHTDTPSLSEERVERREERVVEEEDAERRGGECPRPTDASQVNGREVGDAGKEGDEGRRDDEEEEKEGEDACPDLLDLSAVNKEFKPFR